MGIGVDKYEKYLQDLFLCTTPTSIPAGLSKHLRTCPTCRELFSSLALADRQLARECGVDTRFSAFESEVLWANLSQGLTLVPAQSGSGGWWSRKSLAVSALLSIFFLTGSVFLFFILNSPAARQSKQAVARGGHLSPLVQLYCMGSAGRPRLMKEHPARCSIDEALAFAYMNPDDKYSSVALFALDKDKNPLWYLPDPIHPSAVSIHRTTKPKALPKIVRLSVNHEPGRYFLYYIFTLKPLTFEELSRTVSVISNGGAPPTGSFLRKLELEVEESK